MLPLTWPKNLKKKSLELSFDSNKTNSQQANKDSDPKPSSDSGSKPPGTLRMGNLGNMVNNPTAFTAKKKEEPELKPEPKTTEEPLKIAAEPKTSYSLKEIILDFAEAKKLEGKQFAFTLLKELMAEEQGDNLIITLTNSRDQNEFNEIKTDFLRFVNDKTGKSYQIELKIEKVAQKILKVHTNKDKFNYLAEQNPFLIEFSKELGLELE